MRVESPCKDCQRRSTGERDTDCHDRCPAYIAYRDEVKRHKDMIFQDQIVRGTLKVGKLRFWDDVKKNGFRLVSGK